MTTQPRLWGHADTAARQPELFDSGGRVSELSCSECGTALEHTPGGYLACPRGHGRLSLEYVEDEPADRSGLWFGDDLTEQLG